METAYYINDEAAHEPFDSLQRIRGLKVLSKFDLELEDVLHTVNVIEVGDIPDKFSSIVDFVNNSLEKDFAKHPRVIVYWFVEDADGLHCFITCNKDERIVWKQGFTPPKMVGDCQLHFVAPGNDTAMDMSTDLKLYLMEKLLLANLNPANFPNANTIVASLTDAITRVRELLNEPWTEPIVNKFLLKVNNVLPTKQPVSGHFLTAPTANDRRAQRVLTRLSGWTKEGFLLRLFLFGTEMFVCDADRLMAEGDRDLFVDRARWFQEMTESLDSKQKNKIHDIGHDLKSIYDGITANMSEVVIDLKHCAGDNIIRGFSEMRPFLKEDTISMVFATQRDHEGHLMSVPPCSMCQVCFFQDVATVSQCTSATRRVFWNCLYDETLDFLECGACMKISVK